MKKIFSLFSLLFALSVSIWANPGDIVTSLDQLSPNKTYNIENVRGRLTSNGENAIRSTDPSYADRNADDQRFFIIADEDGSGYYLFSVARQQFLCGPNFTFSTTPALLTITDETASSGSDAYRWFFHHDNNHLNLGGNGKWGFSDWSKVDDGNRNEIVEAESKATDPDPTQFFGSTRPVKFHLNYEGKERNACVVECVIGAPVSVPAAFESLLLSLSAPLYNGETWSWLDDNDTPIIPTMRQAKEDTLKVYFNATWSADFKLSTSFADAHWYNMDVRRSAASTDNEGNIMPIYVAYSTTTYPYPCQPVSDNSLLMLPNYKWAIMGNPFDGIMLINQGAGEGKYLQTKPDEPKQVAMLDGEYAWGVVPVIEGSLPVALALNIIGTNDHLNQNGGKTGTLAIWANSGVADAGNLLRFTEAPASEKELTKVTVNVTYNGKTVRSTVVDAFVGDPVSSIALPSDFNNGLVSLDYDLDATITANMTLNIAATFKLDIALDKSKWYNIDINDGSYYLNAIPTGDKAHYCPVSANVLTRDDLNSAQYQWAFEGNPYEVRVYNRAYGEKTLARYLDPNNGNKAVASMRDGEYTWNVYSSEDNTNMLLGLALEASDNKGQFLNQEGGAKDNAILGFWGNRHNAGCRLNCVEVEKVADVVVMVNVTYHLNYNGKEVRNVEAVLQTGDPIAMPESFTSLLVNVNPEAKDGQGNVVTVIPNEVKEFDVYYTAEWSGIFELSTSFADAHWYNLDIRRPSAASKNGKIYISYGSSVPYSCKPVAIATTGEDGETVYVDDTNKLSLYNYQWAFIGDPYNGVKILNRAAGEGKTLAVNANTVPEMLDGDYFWTIGAVDKNDGFGPAINLKMPDANNCINQSGGADGSLGIWVNGNVNDEGSLIRFNEVPASDKKQTEITLNGIFNGKVIKTGKAFAFVGDKLSDSFTIPNDWDNGLVTFEYDNNAVITENMTLDITIKFIYDIALDGSKWYNIDLRNDYWINTERVNDLGAYMPTAKSSVSGTDLEENASYLWAFQGTPYGIYLFNGGKPGMNIGRVDVNGHAYAIATAEPYMWIMYASAPEEQGFILEYSDYTGHYINQEGGGSTDTRPMGNWTNRNDVGSRFHAIEQPYANFEDIETFFNFYTGINDTKSDNVQKSTVAIYNLDGMRTDKFSKGVNIVRRADGSVIKVLVK